MEGVLAPSLLSSLPPRLPLPLPSLPYNLGLQMGQRRSVANRNEMRVSGSTTATRCSSCFHKRFLITFFNFLTFITSMVA